MAGGWDNTPAAEDGAWEPDTNGGVSAGGWEPDSTNGDGFEISAENISKHADGNDGGCRVCGDEAHFARDCPNKPPNSGECYNCGEMGHSKADCTNERVERPFDGTCNICSQSGHRAKDCPEKPPSVCKVCKQDGHIASECSANRVFAEFGSKLNLEEEITAGEAWKMIEAADAEKDVHDIKQAVLAYAKTYPELTFQEMERVFREVPMNFYLIAKAQEISDTHTIVNLQGKIDQKYAVSFQLSDKPRRVKFAEGWPSSAEENMSRLAEAGFVMDRMVPKCSNCGELGHGSKACSEEKREVEKLAITCAVCSEEGHRARDCTAERKKPGRECKHCGEVGHIAKDCPSKPAQLCLNCGQEGHRKAECENERVPRCRNCEEFGHISKECKLPLDITKVKCRNCEEYGHFSKSCPNPKKEAEDDGATGGGGGDWDDGANKAPESAAGGDWNDGGAAETATGGGDWESAAAPVEATGGW